MLRNLAFLAAVVLSGTAHGQFVYPRESDHEHDPGLYTEDPFIVQYRHRFFAVFKGDYKTFHTAYDEIQKMVAKNPDDARAVVWQGNGETVQAAVDKLKGDKKESLTLLATSRRDLDRAVSLRPTDPNIYMMQAATLYVQGQYWKPEELPRSVWEELRDDCLKFIKFLGPKRLAHVSVHVRGETYGELGIAYKNLGDTAHARQAFQNVVVLCPGTPYADRANKEIGLLK